MNEHTDIIRGWGLYCTGCGGLVTESLHDGSAGIRTYPSEMLAALNAETFGLADELACIGKELRAVKILIRKDV